MEVLLIEDSVTDAELTTYAMQTANIEHRLHRVSDGDEALLFLHKKGIYYEAVQPDLILLDLGLPKVDGRQLLFEIKSDFHLKQIPIVVLTASRFHADVVRTQTRGVDGYLTKPVNREQFVALIKQLQRFWDESLALPAD